jgi:hypothetical protein
MNTLEGRPGSRPKAPATVANGNNGNADLLRERHRLAQMRAWQPRSEKYRELWGRWKREAAHVDGAAPRYRVCGYCAGVNAGGEAASGFLHFACWERVKEFDAGMGPFKAILHRPDSGRAKLWQALLALPEPMTLEAIAVAAWQADPATYGLKGFEELYPCSAHARNALYGPHGFLKRGYLVRKGAVYYVTAAGRALAACGGDGKGP